MSKRHFKFPIVLYLDLISTIFGGGIRTGRRENLSTSIFLPFMDVLAKKTGGGERGPPKFPSESVGRCPQNVGREWVPLPRNTPGIFCAKGRRAFVSVCTCISGNRGRAGGGKMSFLCSTSTFWIQMDTLHMRDRRRCLLSLPFLCLNPSPNDPFPSPSFVHNGQTTFRNSNNKWHRFQSVYFGKPKCMQGLNKLAK